MSDDLRDRYPVLWQFLGCCFHQDFDVDYATADDSLKAWVTEASPELRRQVAEELQRGRPPADDEAATAKFVDVLTGGGYSPPFYGLTCVQWLDHVQAVLDGAVTL